VQLCTAFRASAEFRKICDECANTVQRLVEKNMKFLITGANGFVGKPLCAELLRRGQAVRAANVPVGNVEVAAVGSIGDTTDWTDALRGVNVVVHLAARVHVMRDDAADPLAEFRKVNVYGTAGSACRG
jgi:nucleoside-diphosphate-sugar epimerase